MYHANSIQNKTGEAIIVYKVDFRARGITRDFKKRQVNSLRGYSSHKNLYIQ